MRLLVPSGIGDFSWIYSKFMTLGRNLEIYICTAGPSRLSPLVDILPRAKFVECVRMSFQGLRKRAVPSHTSKTELFAKSPDTLIPVESNTHLEGGGRIENWLPDLGMNFHYPITISQEHVRAAVKLLPIGKYVCIFAANEGTVRAWSGWLEDRWCAFMVQLRKSIGDVAFVLIGAAWDVPLASKIEAQAKKCSLKFVNLAGKLHIGASLHVIQHSEYFVAFASGMGVLGNVLHRPTTMFYPLALTKVIGTWADPVTLSSGEFRELVFPAPAAQVAWLRNVYKLQDKLARE